MASPVQIGAITEALNNKTDTDAENFQSNVDVVVESGSNANGHWRKYKSGKLEQWGTGQTSTIAALSTGSTTITLPKAAASSSYFVIAQKAGSGTGTTGFFIFSVDTLTTTTFNVAVDNANSSTGGSAPFRWYMKEF